jgi:hypothetical protein
MTQKNTPSKVFGTKIYLKENLLSSYFCTLIFFNFLNNLVIYNMKEKRKVKKTNIAPSNAMVTRDPKS